MNRESLAKIGKGTRRKKRDINLLEIAEEVKSIYISLKSLDKVSNIIKLSTEMVREFLKINELEKEVKELIEHGVINSVDIAYRLSKLGGKDQIILAKYIADKPVSSADVRAIIKYKTDNPQMPILQIIDKVIKSKGKKIYVAYLGVEKETFEGLLKKIDKKDIEKIVGTIFKGVIPKEFIADFKLNGRVVILKVVREGLEQIRDRAKKMRIPLSKLADSLIKEYLKGKYDKNIKIF